MAMTKTFWFGILGNRREKTSNLFEFVRTKLKIRELKQTTTTTATRTSLNKRFNEQNNSCARAL